MGASKGKSSETVKKLLNKVKKDAKKGKGSSTLHKIVRHLAKKAATGNKHAKKLLKAVKKAIKKAAAPKAAHPLKKLLKKVPYLGETAHTTCFECVKTFAKKGGCRLRRAGKDASKLITADCTKCGKEALRQCKVPLAVAGHVYGKTQFSITDEVSQ